MGIRLTRAGIDDAMQLWEMQIASFKELLDKYQDRDTNPGNEPVEKVIWRLSQDDTYYYYIQQEERIVGAIRVVDKKDKLTRKRISPLFILPDYRNRGLAQKAILEAEKIHGKTHWELDTILQEKGNCYLYEKMGYKTTGKTKKINEKMTLVYYEK